MQEEDALFLTEEGYHKIEADLHEMSTVRRHEVAERIRDSREHGEFGDDNSEFEDAKFDQAMLEARIQELRQILAIATVIRPEDIPTNVVGVGSIVTVKDLDHNDSFDLILVGPMEADPDNDKISHQSPVGEALYGSKVGDTVEVEVPAGKVRYQVKKIRK